MSTARVSGVSSAATLLAPLEPAHALLARSCRRTNSTAGDPIKNAFRRMGPFRISWHSPAHGAFSSDFAENCLGSNWRAHRRHFAPASVPCNISARNALETRVFGPCPGSVSSSDIPLFGRRSKRALHLLSEASDGGCSFTWCRQTASHLSFLSAPASHPLWRSSPVPNCIHPCSEQPDEPHGLPP